MSDTAISIGDSLGVQVEQGVVEEEDTRAEVADPFSRAGVLDPDVGALVLAEATDCVVILTAL